jgi:hypothetical protein
MNPSTVKAPNSDIPKYISNHGRTFSSGGGRSSRIGMVAVLLVASMADERRVLWVVGFQRDAKIDVTFLAG